MQKKEQKISGHRRGTRQKSERQKQVDRHKQRKIKKQSKKQIKKIRLLASSRIYAFPLNSVNVVAKSIIVCQKHANQGTHRLKLLSEGLQSNSIMYANRNHKQG